MNLLVNALAVLAVVCGLLVMAFTLLGAVKHLDEMEARVVVTIIAILSAAALAVAWGVHRLFGLGG